MRNFATTLFLATATFLGFTAVMKGVVTMGDIIEARRATK